MGQTRSFIASLAFVVLGAGFLLYNTKYPLDTWESPGAGVFPLITGIGLVITAAWQLGRDLLGRGKETAADTAGEDEDLSGTTGERKVIYMIAVFCLYLICLPWIGFYTSNTFFIAATSRLLGARDWAKPLILALGVNLFCYYLFETWLKLSFPRGFLI